MDAPEPLQLLVDEGLHPEADAIDAGRSKRGQPLTCDRFRICLECDFSVGRDLECFATGEDQALDLVGIEQRRRTASKEDGVGCTAGSASNLAFKRRHISTLQISVEQPAIEVAVRTNR